jgi:hypothetical protein
MLRSRKAAEAAEEFSSSSTGLEDATDREQIELFVSSGTTVTELWAGRLRPYAPEAVEQVRARIRRRRQLSLPHRECVVEDSPPEASHCICLAETIDALAESGETRTRAEVLKAAREAHAERWAWLKRKPKPRPQPPAPEPRLEPRRRLVPRPRPETVTETNTRPVRVIKRSPRWYDPPSRDIRDLRF